MHGAGHCIYRQRVENIILEWINSLTVAETESLNTITQPWDEKSERPIR